MTSFIDVPIQTDPDALAQTAFDFIQSLLPSWVPNAGNLDTWLIEATARIAAEQANVASLVPASIFRYLGPLFGVHPLNATSASVTSTWTMRDNAGYTIFAGTLVAIPGPGGASVPFAVLADAVVTAGDTATDAGAVTLVAVTPGIAGSALGSADLAVSPINVLDYVTGVTLTAETTGGIDAETDAAYLNRLAAELRLLTPRPIVPSDFSALARNVAGVSRALTIDLYEPAVNEVQTVTINATSGTFTLSFGGHTTAAIAWNAPASAVQSALDLLASIGANGVTCTGGPCATSPVTVTFIGANGGINQAQMTSGAGSLSGGTHSATVATVTNGAAAITNQERTVTVAIANAAGDAVDGPTKTAVQALLAALREVNFVVNVIDPTYTAIDVTATYNVADGFDAADVTAAVEAALASYLSPAVWGLPPGGDQSVWADAPIVRQGDLFAVVKNVQGVSHAVTLELCVGGGSPAASDVTLAGPAALPTAGTITGTPA